MAHDTWIWHMKYDTWIWHMKYDTWINIYKVVCVVSAVSKCCSKFWKDCYDSKTDATWRFTQRSICFKNLENCLFGELGINQKICYCRMTFFWTLSLQYHTFFTNALLLSHSLKHYKIYKSWHESDIYIRVLILLLEHWA